jgi:hypothetical protein
MRRSREIRELLKKLRSDVWSDIFEAGTTIYRLNSVPNKPVISVLENFANPHNREFAAYALINLLLEFEGKIHRRRRGSRTFARRVYENDYREQIARIVKTLLKVIETDESDKVRAQALETLGMSSMASRRRYKLRRQVEKTVIAALSDDSPEVRFWACYAAGQLKIENALSRLAELAENDTEDWGAWWYVSEEAADAIEWIHGRYTESRIPVAQRNVPEK